MRRLCLLLFAALFMTVAAQTPVTAAAQAGVGPASATANDQAASAQSKTGRSFAITGPLYAGGYGRAYGMRPGSSFTSGLIGGFLGAGLGGLLFGGGFFQAMHGGPGVLGVLLQLFLAYTLAVWVYRRFSGTLAPAGTGLYARVFYPGSAPPQGAAKPGFFGGGRKGRPITLLSGDFRGFEELLHCVQAAWSAHDLAALRSMTTPEMAEHYARQLNEQDLCGLRNQVSDVRLLQGDVSEAWSDGRRDFATVSMTFSMIDVTLDKSGRVVDGSQTERVTVREFWSFVRTPRARWIVSAVVAPS
jgi:predicted lipid-binding transport protein (Tim44 family)